MKRLIAVTMCAFASIVPNVSAHAHHHHKRHAITRALTNVCGSLPTINISVQNQAGVYPDRLALVEQAVEQHSLAVRSRWNTPCVNFVSSGGWTVHMTNGCHANSDGSTTCQVGGYHTFTDGIGAVPHAEVQTGALPYTGWAYAFDHEVTEMVVNPYLKRTYVGPYGSQMLEIDDPVSNLRVTVNNLSLSDFCYPSYFQNGGSWPFDQAGALRSGAWG